MTHLVVSHCTKISDLAMIPVFTYIKKHYNPLPFQLILNTLTLTVLTRDKSFTKGKFKKKKRKTSPITPHLPPMKYINTYSVVIGGGSKGWFCSTAKTLFLSARRVGSRGRNKSSNCLCV